MLSVEAVGSDRFREYNWRVAIQTASSLSFSSDLVRAMHARGSGSPSLSRLAPSVTRVAICVSRVLLDGLQKKERLLVVQQRSQLASSDHFLYFPLAAILMEILFLKIKQKIFFNGVLIQSAQSSLLYKISSNTDKKASLRATAKILGARVCFRFHHGGFLCRTQSLTACLHSQRSRKPETKW